MQESYKSPSRLSVKFTVYGMCLYSLLQLVQPNSRLRGRVFPRTANRRSPKPHSGDTNQVQNPFAYFRATKIYESWVVIFEAVEHRGHGVLSGVRQISQCLSQPPTGGREGVPLPPATKSINRGGSA